MPAELVPQPCEVCLKPTTNRCSECAKAPFDIYFCSRDCQKLVWKLHKTVCGPGKTHPFFVEPLTDEEIADARLPKKALLVSMVRRSRFAQPGQRQTFDKDASMFLLMFSGAVLAQYCRRKLPDDIVAAPWWSKLHHGLLILAILTRKIKQNKKSPLAPIYRRKLIEVTRWFFGAETLPPGPL
ncbi:zinc finger MYND domain-containing protein [Rhodotorula paludigena]|uniref:zinc finger MYND domain-containing protein n=1 Tax=Rhodotorula paludigena TaxID=86838 RepID=UPI003179D81D